MTLDEAIKHAEEVAYQKDLESGFETDNERYAMTDKERTDCKECAKDFRQLSDWLKELKRLKEQEPCEDVMAIHTQGLAEGIRCAMCTNSLKSDRGCDGGCVVNEDMHKEVMNTIKNHIIPPTNSKMEQVEDVISRDELLKAIDTWDKFGCDADTKLVPYQDHYIPYIHYDDVVKCIKGMPSITPQPKMGHWILADEQNKEDVDNDNYRFICSECQCSDIHAKGTKVPYCWNCGAKMESEGK